MSIKKTFNKSKAAELSPKAFEYFDKLNNALYIKENVKEATEIYLRLCKNKKIINEIINADPIFIPAIVKFINS